MPLTYASVCSGIEATSVAWHPLGWQCAFVSEIEPFPCAVLKHHWPDVPNLGDMAQFSEWNYETDLDVLVGGTPCQSFSVAGLRKGLDDPRGDLMLTFGAIAARYRPTWLVWENVPGVLSSAGGKDFASFLGLLTGQTIAPPAEGWNNSGILGGIDSAYGLAWRVLDAQYFGVAQRRRRVFVIGHLGGQWQRAAAVLFERQSLCGNPAPRRQTREGIAPTISARTKGGGGLGTDFDCDGGRISTATADGLEAIAFQERGREGGRNLETQVGLSYSLNAPNGGGRRQELNVCATLTKNYATHHGRPAGNNGEVAENQLIACGIDGGEVGFALRSNPSHSGDKGDGGVNCTMVAEVSEDGTGRGTPLIAECSPTLRAGGNKTGGDRPPGTDVDTADSLVPEIVNRKSSIENSTTMAVRRLTPRECERLQGFPDDYTLIPVRHKPACDGPRYKALGNSMAVPVMRWIGERIQLVENLRQD